MRRAMNCHVGISLISVVGLVHMRKADASLLSAPLVGYRQERAEIDRVICRDQRQNRREADGLSGDEQPAGAKAEVIKCGSSKGYRRRSEETPGCIPKAKCRLKNRAVSARRGGSTSPQASVRNRQTVCIWAANRSSRG
jgi:hypothetical protein